MNNDAIPRVVHWLWLGTNAVPRIFEQYAERWRLHHPSWQTRLWRDDTLPALGSQELLDSATGFKRRYDIVRLEILRQHGGVIVDMDVEPIRPLDSLLQASAPSSDASATRTSATRCSARHPGTRSSSALWRTCARIPATRGTRARQPERGFSSSVLTQYPDGVTVFPSRTFYYEPSFEPPRRPDDFPDVYAVHHQLESYAAVSQTETVERRFDQFVSEVTRAVNTLSGTETANAPVAQIEQILARLAKAERRVRRAVSGEEHRHRAQLHAVRAELEQAVVRFNEHERDQRGLVRGLQRLLARWRK